MKIKEGFILRKLPTANIILPSLSGPVAYQRIFSLNETGAFMWRLLEQGATKQMLLEALRQQYEVAEEEALVDIEAFLEQLESMEVLEKQPDAGNEDMCQKDIRM